MHEACHFPILTTSIIPWTCWNCPRNPHTPPLMNRKNPLCTYSTGLPTVQDFSVSAAVYGLTLCCKLCAVQIQRLQHRREVVDKQIQRTHIHTTVLRLYGFCLGQLGWASTRRNIHQLTPIMVIDPYLLYASKLTTIHCILPVQSTCPLKIQRIPENDAINYNQ